MSCTTLASIRIKNMECRLCLPKSVVSKQGGASHRRFGIPAILAIAVSVAGCSDGNEGRTFAPVVSATAGALGTPSLPTVTSEKSPTPVAPPTLTAGELFTPRGAPTRFYFVGGEDLWGRSSGEAPSLLFEPGPDWRIVDTAASPSGDRVAVLLGGIDSTAPTERLLILDGKGQVTREFSSLARLLPPERGLPVALIIDWSPQGDQVLAAFASGDLVRVDAAGATPPSLVLATPLGTPVVVRWSPSGEAVAMLAGDGGSSSRLVVVPIMAMATPLAEIPPRTDRAVSSVAWTSDGGALLIVERAKAGAPIQSEDLWRIDLAAGERQLVASAGAAAPIAAVDLVRPSPDGDSVAYTLTVPGDGGNRFHSLNIKELRGNRAVEVKVPGNRVVRDLWWTADGLVMQVVPGTAVRKTPVDEDFELYLLSEDGIPTKLYEYANPGEASPAVASDSDPIFSATPVGVTPVAD